MRWLQTAKIRFQAALAARRQYHQLMARWTVPVLFIFATIGGLVLLWGGPSIEFGEPETGDLHQRAEETISEYPPPETEKIEDVSPSSLAESVFLREQSEPAMNADPLADLDLNDPPPDSDDLWNTKSPYFRDDDTPDVPVHQVAKTTPESVPFGQQNGYGPGASPIPTTPPSGMAEPRGSYDPNVMAVGYQETAPNGQPLGPPNASPPAGTPPMNTTALPNGTPQAKPKLNDVLARVETLMERGQTIQAHRELSRLYWLDPESRDTIAPLIDDTSRKLFFDPQPHFLPAHVVQPNERLGLIAKQYDVPWEYLAKLNRLTNPNQIRAGQELKVNHGPFSAVVDLSRYEITIHSHNYFVRRYKIGIGRDHASPIGKFTVVDRVRNPNYTGPNGRVIAADDPANPIGEHWLRLGQGEKFTSFGIHGTIDPGSIGKQSSSGCIRMHNSEVAVVFDLLTIGSTVIIRP